MYKSIAAVGIILLTACSTGIGPSDEPVLELNAEEAATVAEGDTVVWSKALWNGQTWDLRPFEVQGESGMIRVSGSWLAEASCGFKGTVDRQGERLVIRVGHRPDVPCLGVAQGWNYEGRVASVEPGTYSLVIEHEHDVRRSQGVVLETQVTVE